MAIFGPAVTTITSGALTAAFVVPVSDGSQNEALVTDIVKAGLLQPTASSGVGADLTIRGQTAQAGSGGSIVLLPGDNAASGSDGVVVIRQPGGVAGTDECQIYHDGTRTVIESKDGNILFLPPGGTIAQGRFVQISGGSNPTIGTDEQRLNLSGAASILLRASGISACFVANNQVVIQNSGYYQWSSTAFADSGTPDTGFARAAASVVVANNGSSGRGWIQNSAGTTRLSANATNSTTTMANLTDLSTTLIAGRRYCGKMILFVSESVAVDGIKVDFDGGTATMTSFRAHGTVFDTALILSQQTSAIATDFVASTVTGDAMVEIYFGFVCNAAGTFIPRQAKNSNTTGTLTTYLNSHMLIEDSPL